MADITEAARAEVHERYPVWRDGGVGIEQAKQYRRGFVAGAEWADDRSRAPLATTGEDLARGAQRLVSARKSAEASLATARELIRHEADARLEAEARLVAAHEELSATRELAKVEAVAQLSPLSKAARERMILQVADIIDDAPIHISPEGQSIVGDPEHVARAVLSAILSPELVGAESALRVARIIGETHENVTAGNVQIGLPPRRVLRESPVDWAEVRRTLIAHANEWVLVAENVASSTPTQLVKGRNRHFRGEELARFEFSVRKPKRPDVSYPPRRTDLWGRYSEPSAELAAPLLPMS